MLSLHRGTCLAAFTACALGLVPAARAAGPACLHLPPAKVGMQLYSVYEVVTGPVHRPPPGQPFPRPKGSAQQLAKLFSQLRQMGWSNIENFGGTWGLPAEEYERTLAQSGLRAVSSHDDLDPAGWDSVLDRAVAMHQTYVGSGTFPQPGLDTLDHTLQTAAVMNRLGEAAARRGLKFFVHTHQEALRTHFDIALEGDRQAVSHTVFDILAARTNPQFVNFEIDVGWAAAALDLDQDAVAAFLRQYRDRIVMLHVKDMTPQAKPTDLGHGVLNYARLIQAAGPQIAYYLWEYDHPPRPLQSARIAYRYMTCSTR